MMPSIFLSARTWRWSFLTYTNILLGFCFLGIFWLSIWIVEYDFGFLIVEYDFWILGDFLDHNRQGFLRVNPRKTYD